MIETVTPGPAGAPLLPEVALPRVAKMPAPMMAPIPSAIRSTAVSVFLRPCSRSPPSAMRTSRGFRLKMDMGESAPSGAESGGKDKAALRGLQTTAALE